MTYLLLAAIKKELEAEFNQAAFRDPGVVNGADPAGYSPPRLFIGALPPKRNTQPQRKDFPFIVVRAVAGKDEDGSGEMTVKLICGIYSENDEPVAGVQDIHNMVDRTRRRLMEHRMLEDRFTLETPITWTAGSDDENNQPHPYYVGIVTTQWSIPGVQHLLTPDQEVRIYGAGYED